MDLPHARRTQIQDAIKFHYKARQSYPVSNVGFANTIKTKEDFIQNLSSRHPYYGKELTKAIADQFEQIIEEYPKLSKKDKKRVFDKYCITKAQKEDMWDPMIEVQKEIKDAHDKITMKGKEEEAARHATELLNDLDLEEQKKDKIPKKTCEPKS